MGIKNKNRKLNNQGSTFIMVLVLTGFVTLLSLVVTTTAMTNLKMKNINKQATKTFYTAEDAVDEIYAAIGKTSMECFNEAYVDEISSVVISSGGKSVSDNISYNRDFRFKYAKKLLDAFDIESKIAVSDTDYSMNGNNSDSEDMNKFTELLNSYLEDVSGLKVKSVSEITVSSTEKSTSKLDTTGILNNYKINFKNCVVEFKNENNYESYITFDGEIGMPDMVLNFVDVDTSGLSEFTKYAIIGNAGVLQNSGTGTISGNAYAGNSKGLTIGAGASITANGGLLVCAGDVNLNKEGEGQADNYSSLVVSAGSELWADNIVMNGAFSHLTVAGDSYVNDDLQVNGNNSIVNLSGKYYGYGYETTNLAQNPSSAILLNGKNVNLDMSGINTLVIAGRSYIDFGKKMLSDSFTGTSVDETTQMFGTGDSVGYIGAQEIYLVPTILLKDGDTAYSNPCSPSEATAVDGFLKTKLTADTFFGYGYLSENVYRKVTVEGRVYFYLDFKDKEAANNYVKAVFDEPTDGAVDETQNYVKEVLSLNVKEIGSYISLGSGANVYANSSLVLADAQGISLKGNQNDPYKRSDSVLYGMQYTTLRKVLLKEYDNSSAYDVDDEGGIFENFVDKKALAEYIANAEQNPIIDNGAILYACNASSGTSFEVNETTTNGCNNGIIVCDGDVRVAKSFNGTIIASGTITLESNVTVSNDGSDAIYNLLNSHKNFAKIFRAWTENAGNKSDDEIGGITYKELVTFSSWRKYEDK